MQRSSLAILLFLAAPLSFADELAKAPDTLAQSNQLLLVIAPSWDVPYGKLQSFERDASTHKWVATGDSIPINVGKKGMGWGIDLQKNALTGPLKKEGDLKSPVGIFKIGPLFGFSDQADKDFKMNYLFLSPTYTCIENVTSKYYNQLVNTHEIKPDWSNTTKYMRQTSLYRFGSIIQYNTAQPIKSAGSCIFMHIWKGPDEGTAGCIAMNEESLKKVLKWLDPAKTPVIGLFSKAAYLQLRTAWSLPEMQIPALRPIKNSSVICIDGSGNVKSTQGGVCRDIILNIN